MTERLNLIFSAIPPCSVFADVGCDHGYIGTAMLKAGKCETAVFSDISAPSLDKARTLIEEIGLTDKAKFFVCDGLTFPVIPDVALIAGMGGEEIVKILKNAKKLPEKLVLQPMKNARKLREFLVGAGYGIEKDFVFYSAGKFYDLITAKKGVDALTEDELEFGRTNLKEKPDAFIKRIEERKKKLSEYMKRDLSVLDRKAMQEEIERLDKICSR